jgi:glycosyltransferase involved in cell wall biosynthesis
MSYPLVSVIITTKNEERNIANCLKSINSQNLNSLSIEIIVVDNNSTDKTVEIVKSYCHVQLYNFGPERSAQRNYGVKKANGKYILYLDADMILFKNSVRMTL